MFDALDECSSGTLANVVALIRGFKDSVQLFYTSRPNLTNLGYQLDTSTTLVNAHDEDVRNYLTVRLNKEWRHHACFRESIIFLSFVLLESQSLIDWLKAQRESELHISRFISC